MEIRFNFKKDCYIIDLRRALLFSLVFVGIGTLVCFCSGGTHICDILLVPRFALGRGMGVIIWTLMHILVGFSLEILVASCGYRSSRKIRAIVLLCTALVVTYMWIPLFFGMNAFFLAFLSGTVGLLVTMAAIKHLVRLCPLSGFILCVYLIWIAYLTTVSFCVMLLN